MKAKLLLREKITDEQGNIKERVVWSVPSSHKHPEGVRYRLAFIPHGMKGPAVLYDNHHPKGHHKHIGGKEQPYHFTSVHQMVLDFDKDVTRWKRRRHST